MSDISVYGCTRNVLMSLAKCMTLMAVTINALIKSMLTIGEYPVALLLVKYGKC
jgi:hypothetical protein